MKKLKNTLYSIPQVFDRTIFLKHSSSLFRSLHVCYSSRFNVHVEIEWQSAFSTITLKNSSPEVLVYCGR